MQQKQDSIQLHSIALNFNLLSNSIYKMSSTNMSDIILPNQLDVSKISYGIPKQLDNGGRVIYINYASKNLMIQTPWMYAPFGVSVWPGERGIPEKYTLDLSFSDRDSRAGVKDFFDMLLKLSERVVSDALDNSNLWFKKKYPSRDVVDALFTSNIRYSKDKITGEVTNLYPPSFKLNLPYRNGAFNFPVYGANKEIIDLMKIHESSGRGKGSKVKAIIQCTSIWIAGGKFGLSWKVCQMHMKIPTVLTGYAFIPSADDDDDNGSSNPCDADEAVENDWHGETEGNETYFH